MWSTLSDALCVLWKEGEFVFDKDIVLQEFAKTANRLKSRGVDITNTFYGFREDMSDQDRVLWQPEKKFVKVFPDELANVVTMLDDEGKRLSGAELAIVMLLMGHISYNSGMLVKGGGNPVSQSDIERITGFNRITVVKSMDKLVRKKVFARNKVGKSYQYFANPYIFFRGRFINATLVDMFKSYSVNNS